MTISVEISRVIRYLTVSKPLFKKKCELMDKMIVSTVCLDTNVVPHLFNFYN